MNISIVDEIELAGLSMRVVYTIGYEGTDIDRLVKTLKNVGVRVLADVRAVANSRKKGFSKSALKERLEAEGIAYEHFAELGDPKPGRDAARAGRYEEFHRIYNIHLSGIEPQAALKVLAEVAGGEATCLMCFERDPIVCHRSIVCDNLNICDGVVQNLYGDDPNRYVDYADKLPRSDLGEGTTATQ